MKRLLNADEVAEGLGVERSWSTRRRGMDPARPTGRYTRFDLDFVEACAGELERGPAPPVSSTAASV
jgi:hypothetical protein